MANGTQTLGPLDKTFRDTNIVILILFALCCGFIAMVLSIIGVATAKDEKAKQNAIICLVISAISGGLSTLSFILQNQMLRGR